MRAALGIETTIEIGPGPVPDLRSALAALRHVGRENFRLLINTMHFFRSGSSAADIAALDPNVIGYVQLCDVPMVPMTVSPAVSKPPVISWLARNAALPLPASEH